MHNIRLRLGNLFALKTYKTRWKSAICLAMALAVVDGLGRRFNYCVAKLAKSFGNAGKRKSWRLPLQVDSPIIKSTSLAVYRLLGTGRNTTDENTDMAMPKSVAAIDSRFPLRSGSVSATRKVWSRRWKTYSPNGIPGQSFDFSQPIELRVQELIASVRADVGINARDVLRAVAVVGGYKVGEVYEGQQAFRYRFASTAMATERRDGQEHENLRPAGPTDSAGAGPRYRCGRRSRDDQTRLEPASHRVQANVRGRDLASFVADAQAVVDSKTKLPTGYAQ